MEKSKFDLDALTETEFSQLSNLVLKRVALQSLKPMADGHDSHSSSHGKNSISSDFLKNVVRNMKE